MWLDSKAVNCPQKWGNFKDGLDGVLGFHWLKLARIHFDFQNNILSWEK